MKRAGVYKIVNTINNKIYVGSSINLNKRKNQHFWDLKLNKHHCQHLQKAYNKYGHDAFLFEILEECNRELTIQREQYYLDNLKPEYNSVTIAGSTFGYKVTQEMKMQLSKAHAGQIPWSKGKTDVFTKEALDSMRLNCPHRREVEKLGVDDVVLNTYTSMTSALKELGRDKSYCSNIRRAIKTNGIACGFKWKYKE